MVPSSIVIDTNVFIGALMSGGGANRKVLRLCLEGRLAPLMGVALFAEYESLLARRNLFRKCALNEDERYELLDAFLSGCQWVPVYYLWRPNLPDEADNHLVELAAAGGAQVIVTNNVRDFVGEQMDFLNIKAMTPGAFLKELESGR
ncbi:MAG: putative toxin-antitoxin system toxin component, PIN family [Rhodospirillales bacterium]|nr:MAG: putative toxin-antitoxin system toxin component, PIN family [Rhodospirillales bacterium]